MLAVARSLEGQLTCTLHLDEGDSAAAARLVPVLERKAGRLLANGFPTGVEVCDAMVHGGPYPASTNFGATSVGTMAIRRFVRPVCYQDIPAALLPENIESGRRYPDTHEKLMSVSVATWPPRSTSAGCTARSSRTCGRSPARVATWSARRSPCATCRLARTVTS